MLCRHAQQPCKVERNNLLLLLPPLCFKGLGVAKKYFTDKRGICLSQGIFWTRGTFEICKSFSFPLVLKQQSVSTG